MNAKKFSVALGNVRNEYVAEAVTYRHINHGENIVKAKEPTKKTKRLVWVKWGTMAACVGLIFIAAMMVMPRILRRPNSIVPPPDSDVPVPAVSSEEEPSKEDPSKTEQTNWQTIEEICGVENQDVSAVMALNIPTNVAYQGAFYGMVGESLADQTGTAFFDYDSIVPDTGTLEQIRFAATTENVIFNPKAWLSPTYEYTVYLVENHMDCIALFINGYFTIYQKQFDVVFELDGITYGIVYEVVESDHLTLGETLLSNGSYTVYEAIFYLGEPNEHTVYVVDLHPKLNTDGYNIFLEDEVDAWWVAEPIEP